MAPTDSVLQLRLSNQAGHQRKGAAEKYSVSPARARTLAQDALDGIDSHGGNPHGWSTIEKVVNVVVKKCV